MSTRLVDIVLPVYNASSELRHCLDALIDRLPAWANLQIVDDASPARDITTLLRQHPITRMSRVRVLRNLRNLGFVRNVNAAIARTTNDVVLLNSDTVVTHGWLDRLIAGLLSDPAIATVTPFSNNAEICSLPAFCRANPVPADPEVLARAAVKAGPPTYPDLPTGVGFCMAIRREAWADVGELDALTFGRGYGEENDWCFRATARGWRHVLCDDAYVVHVGGMSFAHTGHQPGGEQLEKLVALHPDYNAVIADFIQRDPLALRRQAVLSQLNETDAPTG